VSALETKVAEAETKAAEKRAGAEKREKEMALVLSGIGKDTSSVGYSPGFQPRVRAWYATPSTQAHGAVPSGMVHYSPVLVPLRSNTVFAMLAAMNRPAASIAEELH
jgi:hypothetical protein